ncbi:MAG: hypothetical protein AB7I04_03665 [Pseudomonadales bacterium]
MTRLLFTALTAMLMAAWAGTVDARQLKMWATGTSVPSNASDLDEFPPGFHSTLEGGGNLGPFTVTNAGDLGQWDGSTFCDHDDTGAPVAVLLHYLGFSSVVRTIGGDQLYLRANGSAPGSLCYNFVFDTFTWETNGDIVGGTGRFEGATGSIHMAGSGRSLGNLDPFEAKITGELHLLHSR